MKKTHVYYEEARGYVEFLQVYEQLIKIPTYDAQCKR